MGFSSRGLILKWRLFEGVSAYPDTSVPPQMDDSMTGLCHHPKKINMLLKSAPTCVTVKLKLHDLLLVKIGVCSENIIVRGLKVWPCSQSKTGMRQQRDTDEMLC